MESKKKLNLSKTETKMVVTTALMGGGEGHDGISGYKPVMTSK